MKELKEALKAYFGYEEFRYPQEEIIETILSGKDCIGILPTGTGKSLCFQLPAVFFPGMTIVVSPLVALMKDQVTKMNEAGIPTGCLNSHLTPKGMRETIEKVEEGAYKVLYLAPEKLFSEDFHEVFLSLPIDHIAVDEAHCISAWGHDFRPKYRKMGKVLSELSPRPVISAFTATANERVLEDIVTHLYLEDPKIFKTTFNRPNLFMDVRLYEDKLKWVLSYVKEHEGVGIIYTSTRSDAEKITDKLRKKGVKACCYHAGLKKGERLEVQESFFGGDCQVLVATNAFGMGLDKGDVSFVIHYHMPGSMEAYYQEIGRGGRDGRECKCILLFGNNDVKIQKSLSSERTYFKWRREEKAQLIQEMIDYSHSTQCYRQQILHHFGEEIEPCGYCGNCGRIYEERDFTLTAQKILSGVYHLKGEFGVSTLIAVLRGKKNKSITTYSLMDMSVYGILADEGEKELRLIVRELIRRGYILEKSKGKGKMKKEVLLLGEEGVRFLKEKGTFSMNVKK